MTMQPSTERVDPIGLALKLTLKLVQLVEKCKEATGTETKITGEGITRRAKDLPGLVASVGLIPALTFYMSKAIGKGRTGGEASTLDLYSALYRFIASEENSENELSTLLNYCTTKHKEGPRKRDGEDKEASKGILTTEIQENGYTIMLAIVAVALEKLGLTCQHCLSSIKDLAKALLYIHSNATLELAAESTILEFLTETKKLVEALL